MIELAKYDSLGPALRDALDRWPEEICLIESDRERERGRLTYRQFREAAEPLAAALEEAVFAAGDRAAIIMTNQPKWLVSAYAIFFAGGVVVPLDYKLSAAEHLQLLKHANVRALVVEYPLWRAITQAPEFATYKPPTVLVTEAPPNADLAGATRWEGFRGARAPEFRPRTRKDAACSVYSSGTGGRPKGCVMTHENYLEQCQALVSLYPFWPGVRYLSILPTNHAIDFMVGFIGPMLCGATVVHLRTLRPEFVRDAFLRYKITYMALVPLVLKNLQKGLQTRFAELPPAKRTIFNALVAVNKGLTRRRPNLSLSRRLLGQVHEAFGGELRAFFVGGAFTEPQTLQFFYDLGIPVANGYGLTEAGTAITLNDFKPFRPDTVGKPLAGVELRIVDPAADGVGEVAVRSKTVMSHYLDDPEMTAESIVDGWLMTGDLGRIDASGHLQLFGRKKNMIVTAEGKNIYPEDIENAFEGLPVKEFCVFAANYLWPARTMVGEKLVLVLHAEPGKSIDDALRAEVARRNAQLLNYKRISGYLAWERDFPRTASMKTKRNVLAEEISGSSAVTQWLPFERPMDEEPVNERYFTIVNPAAGGGRCGKLAPAALDKLRAAGLQLEVRETRGQSEATVLAHQAYAEGFRNFIAVGGDGTGFEIVNGLFPAALSAGRPALGFLPLGTGNSFLRDFTEHGADYAIEAILTGRRRPCDVIRLTHAGGETIFFINTLNIGFAADVATLVNRRLKGLGEVGYLVGVLVCLARLRRGTFPLRADGERDDRRCLFLAFSNSKFTGGKMMIAPDAAIDSGTIEYVHWGPIGRIGLIRGLPTLFDGSHIRNPLVRRRTAKRIEFDLAAPVDVVVDGEVLKLELESLEVIPGALDVMV